MPFKDPVKQKEYYKLHARKYLTLNPKRRMLNQAKRRSKQRGLDIDISLEDIEIPAVCPIIGIPIFAKVYDGFHEPADTSPSLDRIDNTKGYVKGNVAVISSKGNQKKSDLTLEQIKNLYNYAYCL